MSLINSSDNPIPEGAVSGTITTPDKIRLRFARWPANVQPCKGTVLLLHGRTEYIEKMFETVEDLRNEGFEVLTFDWRGQGGASRLLDDPRRGFVEHFDQYGIDLETIVSRIMLPDCRAPYFVLAHSTGALVAMLAAPQYTNRFRRLVLCSPLLGLGQQIIPNAAIKWISGAMHLLGLGHTYLAGGATPKENQRFAGNKFTSDTRRFGRNSDFATHNRELTIGGPTASWVFSACSAMEKAVSPDFFNTITIPTLFIYGSLDKVIDLNVVEQTARQMRSGSSLAINGGKHELLHERDEIRQQALAAFFAFVPGSEATDREALQINSALAELPEGWGRS